MSVETVVSIVLGIVLFQEALHGSPGLLGVSLVALVLAFVGLVDPGSLRGPRARATRPGARPLAVRQRDSGAVVDAAERRS